VQDPANRAARLRAEHLVGDARGVQRKGRFYAVWRSEHADLAGYHSFLAYLEAALQQRGWAERLCEKAVVGVRSRVRVGSVCGRGCTAASAAANEDNETTPPARAQQQRLLQMKRKHHDSLA
jgi:hypothetical protein